MANPTPATTPNPAQKTAQQPWWSQPSLLSGWVMHQRHHPFRHRLRYPLFYLLHDLDQLAAKPYRLRWLKQQAFAPFGFYPSDHGSTTDRHDCASLAAWVRQIAVEQQIATPIARVTLLAFPRVLGYVFNPLSLYFLQDADGRLIALLYEVRNTFGQMHHYLAAIDPQSSAGSGGTARHRSNKLFYVSPFIQMDARYEFRVRWQTDQFSLLIQEYQGHEASSTAAASPTSASPADRTTDHPRHLLTALLKLQQPQPLTNRCLRRAFFRWPLLTLQVWLAIHWHGLLLWVRGAGFKRRPPHQEGHVDRCVTAID
jgi:DUF1365 family protein